MSSQVKSCRPEGSPFRAQANEMQDFAQSTSVQREKHKILFRRPLILGRIEAPLEQWQPEEQHGFRRVRRIEEHLSTANMVIDKTLLANTLLWIVSLDLSNAFDRVDSKSLWEALRLHGVSPHLIWLLQMTYANQKGQVVSNNDKNHEFDICAGVRQWCV